MVILVTMRAQGWGYPGKALQETQWHRNNTMLFKTGTN